MGYLCSRPSRFHKSHGAACKVGIEPFWSFNWKDDKSLSQVSIQSVAGEEYSQWFAIQDRVEKGSLGSSFYRSLLAVAQHCYLRQHDIVMIGCDFQSLPSKAGPE